MKIRFVSVCLLGAALGLVPQVPAQSFQMSAGAPTQDLWMYENAYQRGLSGRSPIWATFPDSSGSDSRHSQYLAYFATTGQIPTNQPPSRYLLRRVKFTAVNRASLAFIYDGTADPFASFLSTNSSARVADADAGRPIELFGANFRNGFTALTYPTDTTNGPLGSGAMGERNAYAAGFNRLGQLVDVSNNVGKTNPVFTPFESRPFAVGTAPVTPGQSVPSDTEFSFEFNLEDPFVTQYVQQGLTNGRLWLTLSYLGESAGPTGGALYPDIATADDGFIYNTPTLLVEGTVVRTNDTDSDGLPDDWENFYFTNLTATATQDADGDGANNLAEYRAGTNPAKAASVFKVVAFQKPATTNFVLNFNFSASRTYQIQYSSDLANWSSVTNPVLFYDQPGVAQWVDDGSQTGGSGGNRFYRVQPSQP